MEPGRLGRPRSEQARRAVLAAAADLLESDGYAALTMEGIARAADVSKQTIYRWWPTKATILLEALTEAAQALAPEPNTGSLSLDLERFARQTVAGASGRNGRLLVALMAESQFDPDLADAFAARFLRARRAVLYGILEAARRRGEVSEVANLELAAELFFAGLWYRLLSRHGPLDRVFADQLASATMKLVD